MPQFANIANDALPDATGKASVDIHVPSGSTMKSVSIAVMQVPAGTTKKYDANLTVPTTVVTFSAAPGYYSATFSTYAGALKSGKPSGSVLSAHQNVPLKIVSGKTSKLAVALDSKLATVAFVPSTSLSRSMQSGYALSRCFTAVRVSVLGVDAKKNYILGPHAPKPSLVSAKASYVAVATPPPSATNAFVLSRSAVPPAKSTIDLTAKEKPAAGTAKSAKIVLTFNSNLCGIITEYSIPTSNSLPIGIAAGPDGNLWFTECAGNQIGRITTAGAITEFKNGLSGGSGPTGIAAGPDGNLWFTEVNGNQIGRITTTGAISEFSGLTGGSGPSNVAAGSDGNLWFTEYLGDRIGRITTGASPTVSEFSGLTAGAGPYGIAAGPDGNLWFTEHGGLAIARITTGVSPAVTEFPTHVGVPYGIVAGPDGNLWFTEDSLGFGRSTTAGAVTQFVGGTPASAPAGITVGPDGSLWFAEENNDAIGRITTTGTVTEFPIPTLDSQPHYIVAGPDGALWFTEYHGNKIGRLQ